MEGISINFEILSKIQFIKEVTEEFWFVTVADLVVSHTGIVISTIAVSVVTVFFILYVLRSNLKTKVETVTARMMGGSSRPRFRKRDKVIFYGRKMLRKVKQLSSQATGGRSRMKKRQMVVRFAKRLLRLKKETPLTLQVKEPSQAFLEEDVMKEQAEHRLPAEVVYMLKSIRVFGFFEKPLFLELCKHIEYCRVVAGQLLFSIGDQDDSIYVIQDGRMQVFVTEPDGTELIFKDVPPGESIASLLSIMDVITGQSETYKTVSARAVEDSNVLRLRVEAFKQLLQKYPESLVRVVQVIMVRLQRVTFTALHNYLGLTTQLIKSAPIRKLPLPSSTSPKASPQRMGSKTSMDDVKVEASDAEKEESVDQTDEGPSPPKHSLRRYSQPYFPGENASFKRSRKQSSICLPERSAHLLSTPEERFDAALEGMANQWGIEDPTLLRDKLLLREFQPGILLAREDSPEDSALFYILYGSLLISQKTVDKEEEENTLFVAYPGEIVGALSVITGEPSVFTVKTRTLCHVAVITRTQAYEILSQQPQAVLNLARTVVRRLSPLVRQIDFALDWMHIESGRALYRQDDVSDCTYIVLSGRVRSVLTRSDGKKELVGEYGKGDLVGIVEVLTLTPRATSVVAVRDSELAKLPEGLLNAIKIKYPTVVTRLIHLLGHRILGTLQKSGTLAAERAVSIGSRPSGSNFSTVAVLPVTEEIPLSAFTMELYHALTAIGPTLRLTSDIIRMTLGPSALESSNEYRCVSWLGQQEDQNRIVLYQCDVHFSAWTQRCIRQADCILIVATADREPTVGKVEMQLEHLAVRIQKELILLHREGDAKPRNTVQWLNIRSWCSSTHHICCPKRMFARKLHSKMQDFYEKIFETAPNVHSDFSRLARFLTGTSIGLVLGGGGARGAAHVGMIRAIVEAGIPIDLVGGVSIGAFMGALWCQEKDLTTFTQKAREWSFKMTSYWRQLLDLTYPVTAMFTGAHFNRTIFETFAERQIEDLWLPYFTVTTDITDSTMRVHTHGSLWRYVRSSMSLSGYMPPLCDPVDGHLLLDGGYVNNLPADIMRDMGAETIIAIDVGSQDDIDLTNYGDTLNGWWLLWKRWNPWAAPVKVPSLPEIQSRLAYVSCVRQLEQVKRSDYCTYIRPPIDKYKTLQFGSFDEIMEVGYIHGTTLFTAMKQGQRSLHSLLQKEVKHHQPQVVSLQNASFTDLAEMVCKIKTPPLRQIRDDFDVDDDDEEMDEAGYSSEVEPYFLSDIEEASPSRFRKRNSMSDLSAD